MSKIRDIIIETLIESNQNIEESKFGKALGTAAMLGALGLSSIPAYNYLNQVNTVTTAEKPNTDYFSHFEHGGKGYHAIGKDNYGGYSYGKYQLSTERHNGLSNSMFDGFMQNVSEPFAAVLEEAGGWEAAFKGLKSFTEAWHILADNPKFQREYDRIVKKLTTEPVYKRMAKTTQVPLNHILKWKDKYNIIDQAIFSACIQHGGPKTFNLIWHAVKNNNPKTPEEFLDSLYKYRMKRYSAYKNRYTNELNLMQQHLYM